jgi:hypothetical protein
MMSKPAAGLSALLLAAVATTAMAAGRDKAPAAGPTPEAAVAGHCEAWNATSAADRDRLLAQVFAADGVYSDPTPAYVTGRAALSAHIAEFQGRNPGSRFRCSAPQVHHRAMRVTWVLLKPDNTIDTAGMDFYELGQDGQIRRVTGFFGPPPVTPEP